MSFNDHPLSHGTAFFYKRGEDIYLITNWHNLAGRDPYTKKALKVTLPSNCIVHPININPSAPISAEIGMEVFVLGFPAQLFTDHIPIWKRATIASEYNIHINDIPSFLIDTATYKGMSGSPVILRTRGSYTSTTGSSIMSIGAYVPTLFLGIYSGRFTLENNTSKEKVDEEFLYKAQLGIVWKKELIEEVISSGTIPELQV